MRIEVTPGDDDRAAEWVYRTSATDLAERESAMSVVGRLGATETGGFVRLRRP